MKRERKEGRGGDGERQGKGKDEIQCQKRNSNPCGVQGWQNSLQLLE